MNSYNIDSSMWDDQSNDIDTAINNRMKVWSSLNPSDILGDDGNTNDFGVGLVDDPWRKLSDGSMPITFVNPWGPEANSLNSQIPSQQQNQQAVILNQQEQQSPPPFNNDSWASFDANSFADFETHFTDFVPVNHFPNR